MQDMKKDIVGIEEIKKDRDIRLERLRAELEMMTGKYDDTHRKHSELHIAHTALSEEHITLKAEHDDVCEKLRIAN